MDEKTVALMEDVYSGRLSTRLKNNTKYAFTGAFLGMGIGIIFATLTNKSRLSMGFWGAVIGGAGGIAVAPPNKE